MSDFAFVYPAYSVRLGYKVFGSYALIPAVLLPLMFFGENYIAWYNSLFGESSISVGLMMTLASAIHLATRERGKKPLGWLILLAFAVNFMVCAKAQMLLALPAGIGLLVFFFIYHHPSTSHILYKITHYLIMVALIGYVSLSGVGVYRDNDEVSAKHTTWQSVFYGALMISDDVDAAMKELNIPSEMKPDIGKHAYFPDQDYVYAPMSKEAQNLFYDHVNTFTMVKYYLHHPKDLCHMLNHAATQSTTLHTGFMLYEGQRYDQQHDPVDRFSLWRQLRTYFAPKAFWQYVLLYGAVIFLMLFLFKRKVLQPKEKALVAIWLAVLLIGVLQFPLTVIGNGFADNNKQLYAFMLCHDISIIMLVTFASFMLKGTSHEQETDDESFSDTGKKEILDNVAPESNVPSKGRIKIDFENNQWNRY